MSVEIGIYVGLFDPVHAGHIAFGLQAAAEANVDTVYFLPERMPLHTRPVEHYGHRVAMLERALAPHQQLGVLETADKRFVSTQTIPRLQSVLGAQQFVFLYSLSSWQRLLEADTKATYHAQKFVIAIKNKAELEMATQLIGQYNISPVAVQLVDYLRPDIATEYMQLALQRGSSAPGLLDSVKRYARAEWLYAALPTTHHR